MRVGQQAGGTATLYLAGMRHCAFSVCTGATKLEGCYTTRAVYVRMALMRTTLFSLFQAASQTPRVQSWLSALDQ